MLISDERLSACVDGELSAPEARAIEEAAAGDTELARRLERLRELSRVLGEAGAQIDRAPLPEKVMARLAPAEDGEAAGGGKLLRFRTRGERRAPRRPAAALAASIALLVAGIGIGAFFTLAGLRTGQAPETRMAGILSAPGPVADVLETRPSGRTVPVSGNGKEAVSVSPVLTFESATGGWCREYVVSSGATAMRGVACRERGAWKIVALVAQPDGTVAPDRYVPAQGPSPALLDEVVASLDPGDPLSASAEQELIAREWRR